MNNNNNKSGSRSRSRGRSRTPKATSFSQGSQPKARSTSRPREESVVRFQARSRLETAPVAQQRTRGIAEPKFSRSSGNGDIVVDHEEFVSDITGSIGFSNLGFPVNPGLASTFPWLSQMAPLYESYKFEKLEFCFQSTSATSETGTVMMAVDYDASDPLAPTKQTLAPYRGFVRSAPWKECSNISTREDLNKRSSFFVRQGALGADQDIKLYDTGLLNLAVQGQTGTPQVGELYVRYRVRLMTPQLQSNGVGTGALYSRYSATSEGGAVSTSALSNAPLTVSGTGGVLTLTAIAPMQALVAYRAVGTTVAAVVTTGSTATVAALGAAVVDSGALTVSGALTANFTAVGQTLILDLGTAAATLSSVNYRLGNYLVSLA